MANEECSLEENDQLSRLTKKMKRTGMGRPPKEEPVDNGQDDSMVLGSPRVLETREEETDEPQNR